MRLLLLLAVVAAGCAGAPAPGGQDDAATAGPDVPAVDAAAMLRDLRGFSAAYPERVGNSDDHLGAREWLATRYAEAGLEVWRQDFTDGIPQQNIVGIKWGADRSTWVVVGGHYDMASKECSLLAGHCVLRQFSQGAYDDGSGTLMTVHMANAWAGIETPYTIAFVNFDGEERGLQGSLAFATAMLENDHPYGNVTLRGMLDLDMFGINWPGTIAPVYMDVNSPQLQARAASAWDALGHPKDMIEYHGIRLGRSDYHWFMEAGVPTAFFISSFEKWELPHDAGVLFESTQTGTVADAHTAYPFWHLEDTWETMVAMAGSQADLEAGFDTSLVLAGEVLARMAADEEPLGLA